MKQLTINLILLLLATHWLPAQSPVSTQEKNYFKWLRAAFDEQQAYGTVAYVEQRWRLAGNRGFNESIFYVEKILQKAGFVHDSTGRSKAPLTYRIEKRPLKHPTWEPLDAQLYLIGETQPLLQFKTNRNMIPINAGTANVTAELVYVGKGSDKEMDSADVTGKIVLGETGIAGLYNAAVKRGALGAIAYSMPHYTQPGKYQHSIQFQGIGRDTVPNRCALLVHYAAKEKLKAALAKAPVQVRAVVKTSMYQSEELTLVANVQGASHRQERFVFSAHVQEPGANDNASGVGCLAEMARITAQLVRNKKFKPKRTITFLWGDEIISTRRYILDDSVRAKGIKWGLSLDMVGEDTKKTGGTFLIEKMPDPSAVWTRGEEKHTEWGGSPLKEEALFPHYFNDLLLNRCLYEAAGTGWVVKTNPYEGGSDHTPFLQAKIPGLLMWHFTDVFYHTDGDRLDKVSAAEMKHVGVSALATAFLLTGARQETAIALINDIKANAIQRLQTELALSKAAVQQGGDKETEKHILQVWTDWYIKALATTHDIAAAGHREKINKVIAEAQQQVREKLAACLQQL